MHGSHRTPVLQRLVHRSASTTGTLAHTAGPQEHGFALSIGLPAAHPPYNDNPGRRHDPLFLAEALREGVIFISRGYFQVPAQRLAVFSGFEVKVTELAPWRVSTQATYATIDLRVRALDPGGGARSGLTCQATVSIDDVPCATAGVEVSFVPPRGEPATAEPGRPATAPSAGASPPNPLPPYAVGRFDARNVLVGVPAEASPPVPAAPGEDDEIQLDLAGPAMHWRDTPDGDLLEASRQASIFAAGQLRGFASGSCTVTHWSGQFAAPAAGQIPVRCAARAGVATRTRHGQATVPVKLRFTQCGTDLGTASVTVLEDG